MSVYQPFTGMPGVGAEKIARHRTVTADGYLQFLPGGVVLAGASTRDPDNPDYPADSFGQYKLRAGLLIGKITTGGKWANSVIGLTNGALTSTGTTLTVSAAEAAELNRRVGASGTFTLTGPNVASGVVRSLTVTYSAINLSNGQITITQTGVNEVQTLSFQNSPAGTFNLQLVDLNGVNQNVGPITYSSTAATLVSNIQTALNTAIGSSLVVVSGSAVTAIALTFSGTGYTNLPQTLVTVDGNGLTAGNVSVTRTTAGVDGRFVTISFVQPTDGSQTIRSFLPDGWELYLPQDGTDLPLDKLPIEGNVDASQLLPWPADTSLQQYVRAALNTYGRFSFTEKYAL